MSGTLRSVLVLSLGAVMSVGASAAVAVGPGNDGGGAGS
jgi:hypothetical protein